LLLQGFIAYMTHLAAMRWYNYKNASGLAWPWTITAQLMSILYYTIYMHV